MEPSWGSKSDEKDPSQRKYAFFHSSLLASNPTLFEERVCSETCRLADRQTGEWTNMQTDRQLTLRTQKEEEEDYLPFYEVISAREEGRKEVAG